MVFLTAVYTEIVLLHLGVSLFAKLGFLAEAGILDGIDKIDLPPTVIYNVMLNRRWQRH